jgi:hypothetical protein
MKTDSPEFQKFLETIQEKERPYRTALQNYKVENEKGESLERTEAFYKYKEEAIKIDKW